MCVYCTCINRVVDGAVGEQIGGREHPLYIMRYDNPVDNWYYYLVESEAFYYKDSKGYMTSGRKLHRTMPLNFCPDCGTSLV